MDAGYAAVIGGGTLAEFDQLAGAPATPLDPASARLVGPTYGVHLDATAVATSFEDGLLFETMKTHLHPDDVSMNLRGAHPASPGHELVLAHVPVGVHLPEPGNGYDRTPLYAGWQVVVDGTLRSITDNGTPPLIGTGSIIVVSVPRGSDAYLSATDEGGTQMISLRTGEPRTTP
ncbi:hypothetical protein I6A84_17995 [Frankia sp. CNm7]|uniref:Uncharacterized protein n=1 Tax=Frankia nepalensis TaxID=1836974 RepID=A0A937RTD0_9ACTN|nr:hypothetical protein [Frankia nepalensis]MBL7515628.1 hypothetical protein [Frankia nepalensis]MBL7519934.1 hypothetical protein [Frankia nepalensis]MBL7632423.1 hypothetical protein [Frankia nepalensis]